MLKAMASRTRHPCNSDVPANTTCCEIILFCGRPSTTEALYISSRLEDPAGDGERPSVYHLPAAAAGAAAAAGGEEGYNSFYDDSDDDG
jgi:hypothetical protein